MDFVVVTGCDRHYWPGALALARSYCDLGLDRYAPIACMAYGSYQFVEEVRDQWPTGPGSVLDNPEFGRSGLKFPTGGRWDPGQRQSLDDAAKKAMYCRLLVPKYFHHVRRAMWIDADCLVVQPFPELYRFRFRGHPMASVGMKNGNGHFESLHGLKGNRVAYRSCGSGTMLFNVPHWNHLRITEKCFDVMNTAPEHEYRGVVQSVLNEVIRGDFEPYGWEYLYDVIRREPNHRTKIIHFPGVVPWDEKDMAKASPQKREMVERYWRKQWQRTS